MSSNSTFRVALVHDYLTQRGGAERVALALARAFPGAPLYTSLYEPELTFPEFRDVDVRPLVLNRAGLLRRHHRLAFPLLAPAFARLHLDADVVLCNSSGWAHGVRTDGRKIVYCLTPARWLYQSDRYLGERSRGAGALALAAGRRPLLAWDRAAAATADRYLAISSAVRDRVLAAYGRDADIVPPPHTVAVEGRRTPVAGIESDFFLCISRLLPYKNVAEIVEAFRRLPSERLLVVGRGPDEERLRRSAPANVTLLGTVSDDELRWLYASCRAVVSASYEDFGLTPVEGAAFGKPAATLRWGGFLDTIREGETGVFFAEPTPDAIARALLELSGRSWEPDVLLAHAARYSEAEFAVRMREIVAGSA